MDTLIQSFDGTNLHLAIPISYILAGLAVLGIAWIVLKKVLAIAMAIISRAALASATCAGLMLGGLGGVGYSVGEFASGKYVGPKAESAKLMTNDELIRLAGLNLPEPRFQAVLAYTKEREDYAAKYGTPILETAAIVSQDAKTKAQDVEFRDYRAPWTGLGSSLASMLISGMWYWRQRKDAALDYDLNVA